MGEWNRRYIAIFYCSVFLLLGGCNLPQTKKLEQENSKLKISLEQCRQEKLQIEDKISQQESAVSACKENLIKLQREKSLLEKDIFQLKRQIELCKTEIEKYKAEQEKFSALVRARDVELADIKKSLMQARRTIESLNKRIEMLKAGLTQTTKPSDDVK